MRLKHDGEIKLLFFLNLLYFLIKREKLINLIMCISLTVLYFKDIDIYLQTSSMIHPFDTNKKYWTIVSHVANARHLMSK